MFYINEREGKNYWRYVDFLNNSNNILTFSSPSNTVEILDSLSGKSLKSFKIEQDIMFLTGFSVSKNNKLVAIVDFDNTLSIWDIDNETPLNILGSTLFPIESDGEGESDCAKVLFSDDNKYLIFGTAFSLNLLDIENNQIIEKASLVEENYYTRSLSLSPSNNKLAIRYGGSNGEELVILDFPSFKEITRMDIEETYIEIDEINDEEYLVCEFNNENEVLINSLNNNFIEKFIIDTNEVIKSEFQVKERNQIKIFKLSKDREKLFIVTEPYETDIYGYANRLEIWDIKSQKFLSGFEFNIDYGKISLSNSSDNKLIAITTFTQTEENEYTLLIYDLISGECKTKLLKNKYI